MRPALLAAAILLVACGSDEAADSAVIDSTPAAPPALTAADVTGTWNYEVRGMGSDSIIATGQTVVGGDPLSVTQTATGGEPATGTISITGDAVSTQVGPYPSALRPGVMVTTSGTYRMVEGDMVGTTTARYTGVTTADSVVELRVRMTRAPE
ncbi:MAG TPA: hypothetical protein PLL69_02285 [Gemmatimonadales bacterium]|nr:hypothetical protein [Gemmatimonadales bacterium]